MGPAATIVLGKLKPDFNKLTTPFRSFAMAYVHTTKTLKHRSVPTIALNESNEDGGY